jgi:hypothetical protein
MLQVERISGKVSGLPILKGNHLHALNLRGEFGAEAGHDVILYSGLQIVDIVGVLVCLPPREPLRSRNRRTMAQRLL